MQRTSRFYTLVVSIALLSGLVPLVLLRAVSAAASLQPGFTDTDFATGFGGRLTTMTFAPDGRLFVAEKDGAVRVVKNGTLLAKPFLSLTTNTDSERGVEGIDFDPNYASNGYVYVYYTDATTIKNKVSRFTISASNPDVGRPVDRRRSSSTASTRASIHNGWRIYASDSDGKLYIGTGDATYKPNCPEPGQPERQDPARQCRRLGAQ